MKSSQFCQMEKDNVSGFIDCVVAVAQAGNNSTGVVGCWENSARRTIGT